jgi:predicted ATPase
LLVRSVLDSLTEQPSGQPVVVAVDDAHLLDDLSAFVVHQLVHRRLATMVLTVRSSEAPPDAITGLWKDSYLQRIDLRPLSRGESDCLLESALGDRVTTLWRNIFGN